MFDNDRVKKKSGIGTIQEDDVLYMLIAVFLLLGIVLWGAVRIFHLEDIIAVPCTIYRLTGWYCPGCGGTRAIAALFHGDLLTSLVLHPLVGYVAVFLIAFMGSRTLHYLSRGRIRGMHWKNRYLAVGGIILAVNWAIKNYFLIEKGIDLLPHS